MALVIDKPCPVCGQSIDSTASSCCHCGESFDAGLRAAEDQESREARERFQARQAEGLYGTAFIGCFAALCLLIGFVFRAILPLCAYPASLTFWMPPLCAIYGVIFLRNYREPFPLRWKAVAGTILHWTLSGLIAAAAVSIVLANVRR
jgi:hypothetical protein